MHKKLISLSVSIFLLASPLFVSAATMQELQAQVQALMAQIMLLQAGGGVSMPATSLCVNLTYNMGPDDTDADTNGEVTKLQRFLAQDPSIYPEGRITGYFGPATTRAVQRWQKAGDLVWSGDPDSTGYGYVGPRTRAAMVLGCTGMPVSDISETRRKGRDASRVADIKQLQLALELYYDTNNRYPASLNALSLVSPGYINRIPVDPLSGASYSYSALGAACNGYHLGAALEGLDSASLQYDSDAFPGVACAGSASDFSGADPVYDAHEGPPNAVSGGSGLSVVLISGKKSVYAPGEKISLILKATETSDGTSGTPEEGYNIQAYITGVGDGYSTQGENATYNYQYGYWETKELVAPTNALKTYKVDATFYCSNATLKCGQIYSSGPTQDKGQVSTSFTFTLSTTASPLTITYPTSGASVGAGQSLNIQWTGSNPESRYMIVVQDSTGGRFNATNAVMGGVIASAGSYQWNVPYNYANGNYQIALFSLTGTMNDDARLSNWANVSITGGYPSVVKPVIVSTAAKAAGNLEMDAGGTASIYGYYLAGNFVNTTNVFIGGIKANVLAASDDVLSISVPSTLQPGQSYDMYISNEKGTSNIVRVKILSKLSFSATVDPNNLWIASNLAFSLGGPTSASSGSFTVAIVGPNYIGSTDWAVVSDLLKGWSAYTAVSNTAWIANYRWSAYFGGLPKAGHYTILIYDPSYALLSATTLQVTP